MSSEMKYNFGAVDSHSLTFGSIVGSIQENNDALKSLEKGLRESFTGAAAEQGWQPQITALMAKIDAYRASLEKLKATVQSVAGGGGLMQMTDKDQGGRFLALKI